MSAKYRLKFKNYRTKKYKACDEMEIIKLDFLSSWMHIIDYGRQSQTISQVFRHIRRDSVAARSRLHRGDLNHLSAMTRPEHDDAHAKQADSCPNQIGDGGAHRVDGPKPEKCNADVHAAISGIDATGGMRVQGKKPDKGGQAECGGHKQPNTVPVLEPEIR